MSNRIVRLHENLGTWYPFNEKVEAVAQHYDIDPEDPHGDIDAFLKSGMLVLTDFEADEMAKERILDSAWTFNAHFLSDHSKADAEVFEILAEKMDGGFLDAESSNDVVLSLIEDTDKFVQDAISAYGRGQFLASCDHCENEEVINGTTYYIYQN